jgi:hypothetical protein
VLISTDEIYAGAYGVLPETLQESPTWSSEYPIGFTEQYPQMGGYSYYSSSNYTPGYYLRSAANAYDFQLSTSARGLIMASHDPFNAETSIEYDVYNLLPVLVTDPELNSIAAFYNYRVLQVYRVIDINQNISVFDFSPLGLLRASALLGKGTEGDYKGAGTGFYNMYEPSTRLAYDFNSFKNNRLPVWVKTIKREYHFQQFVNDNTITTIEYSDGFGRMLQTRTQAEDVIFGNTENERITGSSGLPSLQSENANTLGVERYAESALNVVVNGWQIFNNKGKVVEKYEPYFDAGFDFLLTTNNQKKAKIKIFYDPRGQVVRTINPDESEQRVIYGVPLQVSQPGSFVPTAWETYTYDANDLDPNSPHFGTPNSAKVDALGRTVQTIDRLESNNSTTANVRMLYEYDVRGNLLNVYDAYNNNVFLHKYDLRSPNKEGERIPPLYTRHINKGISTVVFDCTGKPVETRDAKGALSLVAYDMMQRPLTIWCRDIESEAVTKRQVMVYGYDSSQNNTGKLVEHYDESGYQNTSSYDFKGNLLYKIKQVIDNNGINNAIYNSYLSGWNSMYCYRVNWDAGITLTGYFETNMDYDALNRITRLMYPIDDSGTRNELYSYYNNAGALKSVYLGGTEYVKHIAYNAKGQRLLIAYGNSLMTRYTYNEQTFRLERMRTERYSYYQSDQDIIMIMKLAVVSKILLMCMTKREIF